jgi:hypothetical protein
MMNDWHPDKKRRLRREVLRILSTTHGQQQSRLDDVALCHALRTLAWEVDLADVITVLQDMGGRGWVRYRQLKNVLIGRRVQLLEIEIAPEGQDVFDQVKPSDAVEY